MNDERNSSNPRLRREQEEEREYLMMIIEEIMGTYSMSLDEAEELMIRTSFVDLFHQDRDFFYHYQPEQIAEMIYKSKIPQNL